MCGLVGIAGKLAYSDESAMRRLFLFDYLRGPDATGLAAVRTNGEVLIAKQACDPITLFGSKAFDTALTGHSSKVFLGHNRAATRGMKNNFNAHPFHYGHIVGAHNGTLDIKSWDALEEAIGEKFNVDSQALIAAIAKLGVKAAIELCYEGKDYQTGAWSLVWYDEKEGSLNFLRNQHRPMWIAYDESFDRILWASEWWMLDTLNKTGSDIKFHKDKKGYAFFPTDIDVHYKFDIGLMLQENKLPKPKTQKIEGKEAPAPVQSAFPTKPHGIGFGVTSQNAGVTTLGSSNSSTTTSQSNGGTQHSNKSTMLQWYGSKNAPFAGLVTQEKFQQLAKYGCSWCQCDLEFLDEGVTIYERDDMILCATCSGYNDSDPIESENRIYVSSSHFDALK
jgi:hypothetical protein